MSIVDDTDEGSMNSDNIENVYDGIINLESTGSDNGEGDNNPVHQLYDRMTLRSRGKNEEGVAGEKNWTVDNHE